MMIIGQLHHGIVVSDIEKSIGWYCGSLGMELVRRQRQQNDYTPILVGVPEAILEVAQLRIPSPLPTVSTHDIELIEYIKAGISGEPAPVNQPGSAHLGFFVTDLAAHYESLRSSGTQFRNPPTAITEGANKGGWACYFHDPDGNTLEFIQPSPERLASMQELLNLHRS
ncbi:VOC family protein [Pseudarthrobacter sp. R1]|uniref:VOC family protein n=1 Tax=Pseudarthrobacter sp. R1 TaxID=2944934 RepID=UPI00210A413E|nr:VOC family protein [Pseudarthrobacter sp. R1]MCQ6272324.1 VOC family protein [Pseudarthrobacter sp. R1]